MTKLLLLFVISLTPIQFWGQSFSYSPTGKMKSSEVMIDSIITTKLTKTGLGVVLAHIDTSQSCKDFPFYNTLTSYFEKYDDDSGEYFFLFNGTNKSIKINKHASGELVGTELGESREKGFRPISVYPSRRCGFGFGEFSLLPGQILTIQVGHASIVGSYKTRVQLRIRTSGNNIIYSSLYTCLIDENCFNISSEYQNDFVEHQRNLLTLQ